MKSSVWVYAPVQWMLKYDVLSLKSYKNKRTVKRAHAIQTKFDPIWHINWFNLLSFSCHDLELILRCGQFHFE